nr:hypothetical protein [Tanacetum cinerariifolium]
VLRTSRQSGGLYFIDESDQGIDLGAIYSVSRYSDSNFQEGDDREDVFCNENTDLKTRTTLMSQFVSALPNVDTLSDAVNHSFFASQSNNPQLDNDDLKQIYVDDLEEMNLKRQMAMWSATTSIGEGTLQGSAESDDSFPPSPIYDRYQSGDRYHAVPPPYIRTFMPPKCDLVFHDAPNVNETAHTAFNVELSLTKPNKDLSLTHSRLAPIIEDWVFDSEDDSETKIPQNVPSFVQPTEQVKSPRPSIQHVEISIPATNHKTAIPKPKSNGNRGNRKACFVFKSLDHLIKDCNFYEKKMAKTSVRNHSQRGYHQQYARMTLSNPQKHVIPTTVLTKSKLVPITAARPVTVVVPKPNVTRPRQAKTIVTKPHSPPRRHINHSPSPKAINFPSKVTA